MTTGVGVGCGATPRFATQLRPGANARRAVALHRCEMTKRYELAAHCLRAPELPDAGGERTRQWSGRRGGQVRRTSNRPVTWRRGRSGLAPNGPVVSRRGLR